VIAHPQTQALGILQEVGVEAMQLVASPLRFDGIRPKIFARAPALGADTDTALALIEARPPWKDPPV
jgi:crotonobetainyl-CoA:carnitine CoA-transferase CaiB-like acyl-CoA transferase